LTTDLFEITFGLKLRRAEQPTCKCEVVSPVRGQNWTRKHPHARRPETAQHYWVV